MHYHDVVYSVVALHITSPAFIRNFIMKYDATIIRSF